MPLCVQKVSSFIFCGVSERLTMEMAGVAFHLKNALFPMLVTELGIVIEVRLSQYANASSPILVTELGMLTVVISEPQNA